MDFIAFFGEQGGFTKTLIVLGGMITAFIAYSGLKMALAKFLGGLTFIKNDLMKTGGLYGTSGGKIMGGAKKVGEKILAPVKGLWTKLMDFLIGILLGKAVISLFEWFTDPANTDKVSSLFKFLKD